MKKIIFALTVFLALSTISCKKSESSSKKDKKCRLISVKTTLQGRFYSTRTFYYDGYGFINKEVIDRETQGDEFTYNRSSDGRIESGTHKFIMLGNTVNSYSVRFFYNGEQLIRIEEKEGGDLAYLMSFDYNSSGLVSKCIWEIKKGVAQGLKLTKTFEYDNLGQFTKTTSQDDKDVESIENYTNVDQPSLSPFTGIIKQGLTMNDFIEPYLGVFPGTGSIKETYTNREHIGNFTLLDKEVLKSKVVSIYGLPQSVYWVSALDGYSVYIEYSYDCK